MTPSNQNEFHDKSESQNLAFKEDHETQFTVPIKVVPFESLVKSKLALARIALENEDYYRANELSHELSRIAPDNIEVWLLAAALSESSDDKLSCLSRAINLEPENSSIRLAIYQALRLHLQDNPFLRYYEQNDLAYQVVTGEGHVITVSKDRVPVAPYPLIEVSPLQGVSRWLLYAIVTLPLGGFISLLCASVSGVLAWRLTSQPLDSFSRRRLRMQLVYATVLWLGGFLISFVFLLHLL